MDQSEAQPQAATSWWKTYLFMPLGCLLTASPYVALGGLALALIVGLFTYYNYNIDLFGIGAPNFKEWTIDNRFEWVRAKEASWKIQYETGRVVSFRGKVRNATPIREGMFPVLTHDILITSGDYANVEKVDTSVDNHHFRWVSLSSNYPQGTINLLHTVPWNETIYRQLLEIRNDQEVVISGYEISTIEAFDADGQLRGTWQDTGCNSTLVNSVTIAKP